MKKLFTSFVVASTVAACGSGAKTDTTDKTTTDKTTTDKTTTDKTTTDKTTTTPVVKGKSQQGTFKIGVYGTDLGDNSKDHPTGMELTEVIAKYTQDIKLPGGTDAQIQTANDHLNKALDWKGTGDEYLKLPSQLSLLTSFEKYMVQEDGQEAEQLSDKTKLADENLDALFVQVTDEKTNSSAVYKTVVEKKEFGNTKLFFIGKESESQDGSSSKTFAGENVSTASFNKFAAAYIGGFQAAAGAIKYNSTEDMYEETTVSFLIGALEESDDRKKAFAFRRGVEAASKHAEYSKYLKVKFVKKTEDESSSKKLYRGFGDWTNVDDGKTKLYEFAGSDTFRDDVDRSVIYISGATAKQWSGWQNKAGTADKKNEFQTGDNAGLVGALYNYNKANFTTDRRYSKGVWVVLDAATSKTAADDSGAENKAKTGDLTQIFEKDKGQINMERHEVVFYGALGAEKEGTKSYTEHALKGLYMGGPSYMIGKHTIFGAGLDLSYVNVTPWTKHDDSDLHRITPWLFKEKKDGDSASKVKGRFDDSLEFAWEKEVTEAELTKSSPWLK